MLIDMRVMMEKISVTILTKNSCRYLVEVLEALGAFDEVLIYDNGSIDATLEIAARYPNVTIQTGAFTGFGPTHNIASSLAKNDWILSIDSDEVVTPEMIDAIADISLDQSHVYSFPRRNYFNGRWIRWCGWHPDRQLRLYHRGMTRFTDAKVHEAIIVDGLQHIAVDAPIIHYSYDSLEEFLSKMQAYSTLFAEQYAGKRQTTPFKAIGHGLFAFLKSYFIKRGVLGGYEGFVISTYNGHTAFYKYLKLYEANQRRNKT